MREKFGLVEHRVVMSRPDGAEFDVTDRLVSGSPGRITQRVEEDFLVLTHGDAQLDLHDQDGAVEQFLRGVEPTDLFEVVVERFTRRRRVKWERLFGGVLDLPWSVRIDRKSARVAIQAFSYSKLLERTSAEGVRRSFGALTGNVTAGSSIVTVSSSTNMKVGDDIKLQNISASETHRIRRINSSIAVTTDVTWTNTFSAGTLLTVETPYYRNKPPSFLAAELFVAAGVVSRGLELGQELAAYPVPTPLSEDGYPRFAAAPIGELRTVDGMWIQAGKIRANIDPLESPTNDFQIDSPIGTWADAGGASHKHDWTIHRDAEPATVFDKVEGYPGVSAPDYSLSNVEWQTAPDVGTNRWDLYRSDGGGVPVATLTINGSPVQVNLEFPPEDGKVWISQVGATADAQTNTRYWDGAALQTIEASLGGHLRYLRRLKLVALHERASGTAGPGAFTTNLHLYDPVSRKRTLTITVPKGLHVETLRVFGRFIAGLYILGPKTRCIVWDQNFSQVADYEVGPKADDNADVGAPNQSTHLTVFTGADGIEVAIAAMPNAFHVLAKTYAGVVPYADFDGLSVGGALRELAIVTNAYVAVDEYKTGILTGRANSDAQLRSQAFVIDTPLGRTSWPLTEFYRSSALVTGEDADGNAIEVIVGDTGDSGHRLELDGQLITTGGLAGAVGNQYVSTLSRLRRQEEIEVAETDRLIPAFSYVRMDATDWLVHESELDPESRQYRLRLLEVEV